MTKLRNATGFGLLLFMATMIGGLVEISHAQANGSGVTVANLAGKFSSHVRPLVSDDMITPHP